MTRITLAAMAIVLIAFWIGAQAVAVRATGTEPLRYRELGGDGPNLVIKGTGCFSQEDVTELRLVEYDGANTRVVYRCVQP